MLANTYIFASTYPTIFPFSSSAIYESWNDLNGRTIRDMTVHIVMVCMIGAVPLAETGKLESALLVTCGHDKPW